MAKDEFHWLFLISRYNCFHVAKLELSKYHEVFDYVDNKSIFSLTTSSGKQKHLERLKGTVSLKSWQDEGMGR
jgi:hypothetical protein